MKLRFGMCARHISGASVFPRNKLAREKSESELGHTFLLVITVGDTHEVSHSSGNAQVEIYRVLWVIYRVLQ